MQKRTYDRKELILIVFVSAVILAAGVFLKLWDEKRTEGEEDAGSHGRDSLIFTGTQILERKTGVVGRMGKGIL